MAWYRHLACVCSIGLPCLHRKDEHIWVLRHRLWLAIEDNLYWKGAHVQESITFIPAAPPVLHDHSFSQKRDTHLIRGFQELPGKDHLVSLLHTGEKKSVDMDFEMVLLWKSPGS